MKKKPQKIFTAQHRRVIMLMVIIILSGMVISGTVVCMFYHKIETTPAVIMLFMMTVMLVIAGKTLFTYGNPMIKSLLEKMEHLQKINEELELEIAIRKETESSLQERESKAVDLSMALNKIRKKLEDELENYTDSLKQRNQMLQKEIKERIRVESELKENQIHLIQTARLASLGEMAAGVAHELNQPLSMIRLYAELILAMLKKMEQEDHALFNFTEKVDGIIIAVDRAAGIIYHLQDFSRSRNTHKIKLNPLMPVKQALVFFRQYLKENGFVFDMDFEENLPEIIIDYHQLEEITVNLMSNAVYAVKKKAGDAPGGFKKKIQIRMHHEKLDHAVVFEVIDNGIGMTDHEKRHCQEPFFTTREVGEGTGLGLSIVHGIVRELNGRLDIDSEKNKGTRIRVELPLQHSF